jgi:hypothetical protein
MRCREAMFDTGYKFILELNLHMKKNQLDHQLGGEHKIGNQSRTHKKQTRGKIEVYVYTGKLQVSRFSQSTYTVIKADIATNINETMNLNPVVVEI